MDWFLRAGRSNNDMYAGRQNPFNRMDRPLNHDGVNFQVVSCPLNQGRAESRPCQNMEWGRQLIPLQ